MACRPEVKSNIEVEDVCSYLLCPVCSVVQEVTVLSVAVHFNHEISRIASSLCQCLEIATVISKFKLQEQDLLRKVVNHALRRRTEHPNSFR